MKNWFNELNCGRRSARSMKIVQKQPLRPGTLVPELIMQDRHVTYREIEASLGISCTSIHSILHVKLAVKNISSHWIPYNLIKVQKRFVSIGVKKCWKNTVAVPQKTFTRSSQVTNHESVRMSPKQSNSPPCWSLNPSQLLRKLFCKTFHVATVPLEHSRTINSERYTTICLPSEKFEKRTREDESLFTMAMRALMSAQISALLTGLNVEFMGHLPYSPDIPHIKKKMRGQRFSSPEDTVGGSKTMFWRCLNRSGETNTNDGRTSKHSE